MLDHGYFDTLDDAAMGKEIGGIRLLQASAVASGLKGLVGVDVVAAAAIVAVAAAVGVFETCSALVDCRPCPLHQNGGYNGW